MKWPAGLLNIEGQHTVRISGTGKVNAQGKPFWDQYWALRKEYEPKGLRWVVDYDAKRPRTLIIARSKDVSVEGITLEQAGFWTVHVLYSTHVTCDGLIIRNNVGGHGPSTDGIDIDSSSYVLAQNCDIDCNDDDFCIKSGRDADGLRVNRPTEYVVIQNCIARKGGGLITFGSETSGGFRHILARNLRGEGTKIGIRFKSAKTRGGLVEDIHLEDINMTDVVVPIEITMDWNASYSYSTLPAGYDPATVPAHWKALLEHIEPPPRGIPRYRNVFIKNVTSTGGKTAISAAGLPESQLENFHFENVRLEGVDKAGTIRHASGWTFENVVIEAKDPAPLKVEDSTDMKVPISQK
jgi:polygalacturonase